MKRVIIVGSPRSKGRSAHLAEMLFEANIDERPEDELFLVPVSEIEVGPCIGCNACRVKTEIVFTDDDGNEVRELCRRCVFDDDMQGVYDLLDQADTLTIVCPVYFSGAPAPMKCLLDRLQPYFWDYRENGPRLPKRPLELHILGEGGDPHGFVPLISEVKGTTALAGFGLERILSWVGKIGADGEILAEAEEVPVPPRGSYAVFAAPDAVAPDAQVVVEGQIVENAKVTAPARADRAKLSFSQEKPKAGNAKPKGGNARAKGGSTSSQGGRQSASGKRATSGGKGQGRSQAVSRKAQSGNRGQAGGRSQSSAHGKGGGKGGRRG